MSDGSTFAIAQVLQGLAGAGAQMADLSYQNDLAQIGKAQAAARLAKINARTQEILDANAADQNGIDLNAAKESMGSVGTQLYSSLPTGTAREQPLAEKIRAATTSPTFKGTMPEDLYPIQAPVPQTPAAAPTSSTPSEQPSGPVWQRTLDGIMKQKEKQVDPVVAGTNRRMAAWVQAAMESGMDPKAIKEMTEAGGLTRDLAKDTMESADKLIGNKREIGTDYLKQTSEDARLASRLASDQSIAGLHDETKKAIARAHERGASSRAKMMADALKGNVQAFNALRGAASDRDKTILSAIEKAGKTKSVQEKINIYNAAGIPFTSDTTSHWISPDKVNVTPHPEQVLSASVIPYWAQMEGHAGKLREMLLSDEPAADSEDPNPPVTLPSANAAESGKLGTSNPTLPFH